MSALTKAETLVLENAAIAWPRGTLIFERAPKAAATRLINKGLVYTINLGTGRIAILTKDGIGKAVELGFMTGSEKVFASKAQGAQS